MPKRNRATKREQRFHPQQNNPAPARGRMREFYTKSGSRIIVMPDKFRPSRYAFGVAASRGGPMRFVGNLPSFEDAIREARQARRQLMKQRRASR